MREKYGVVVAGGQSKVKDKVFRIGHLGYVSYGELQVALTALEAVLIEAGLPVKKGLAAAAAGEVLLAGLNENPHLGLAM